MQSLPLEAFMLLSMGYSNKCLWFLVFRETNDKVSPSYVKSTKNISLWVKVEAILLKLESPGMWKAALTEERNIFTVLLFFLLY